MKLTSQTPDEKIMEPILDLLAEAALLFSDVLLNNTEIYTGIKQNESIIKFIDKKAKELAYCFKYLLNKEVDITKDCIKKAFSSPEFTYKTRINL
jgi:hypothetical protein